MPEHDFKLFKYRWVVLAVYVLISIVIEIQWLTFAPVASAARAYYKATSLQIDLLSMLYMIIFIVFCIPASYVIDTYGLKKGLWIGAGLTGIFGLMKGVFASDYIMVLIAQTGLAVAQPFILNALTKIGVTWFPLGERATAAGLGTLAQYIGIIVAMVLTPHLIASSGNGVFDLKPMLMIYGIASLAAAAIFLVPHEGPSPDAAFGLGGRRALQGLRRHAVHFAEPGHAPDAEHLFPRAGDVQRDQHLHRTGLPPTDDRTGGPGRGDDAFRRDRRRRHPAGRFRQGPAGGSRSSSSARSGCFRGSSG